MLKGNRDSSLLLSTLGNETILPHTPCCSLGTCTGLVLQEEPVNCPFPVGVLSLLEEPGHSAKDSPPLPHHKRGLYLGLIGKEGKVDLFQRLHHLRQARAAQFTEQGLGACCVGRERLSDQCSVAKLPTSAQHPTPWLAALTVSEEDMGCFVGNGWCPLEICNQSLNRLGRTDHCWSQALHSRLIFRKGPPTDISPLCAIVNC